MVLGPNQSGKPCDSQKASFSSPTSHAHDDDNDDEVDDDDDDHNYHHHHQVRDLKIKSGGGREVFRCKIKVIFCFVLRIFIIAKL